MNIDQICRLAPVVPVLIVEEVAHAAPLARALVAGGLKALEVTMRTDAALDAIRAMADAAPDAVIGAGTLRSAADVRAAVAAGARFGVSPGLTPAVMDAAAEAKKNPAGIPNKMQVIGAGLPRTGSSDGAGGPGW